MYLSMSQKVPTYINNNEIIIKILKGVWLKIVIIHTSSTAFIISSWWAVKKMNIFRKNTPHWVFFVRHLYFYKYNLEH